MSHILADFKIENNSENNFRNQINLIMNTLSFRKLAGKTQVIISLAGPGVRTRLTHTVEVAKIARDLCLELGLNEELAEAIALAHDIGHTPFGHVGERTLRDIMCGCDTLGNKFYFEFKNSGFKHNLQSLRVLNNLEKITELSKYILWGIAAHSKMSYTPVHLSSENEILIHCKHCPMVYECNYSYNKNLSKNSIKKCKYNIKNFRSIEKSDIEKLICKPWYCAFLNDSENEIKLEKGWENTYCYKKCYFAMLWCHKIQCREHYEVVNYLFDHPFSNSFYAEEFYNCFNSNADKYISFEAIIVAQSDEIAQRKQDLEDGLNTGLIEINDCIKKLTKIFKSLSSTSKVCKEFLEKISNKNNKLELKKEIGNYLGIFLKEYLLENIILKTKKFSNNIVDKSKVTNVDHYNIIYLMLSIRGQYSKFLFSEKNISEFREIEKIIRDNKAKIENKLNIKITKGYNYYIYSIHQYIVACSKYKNSLNIKPIKNLINFLKNEKIISGNIEYFSDLENLIKHKPKILKVHDFLDKYRKQYVEIYKSLKYIYDFNLYEFKYIYFISKNQKINNKKAFSEWKKIVGLASHRTISNIVDFTDEIGEENPQFEELKKYLKNTILKSESVEKNDGKASYIITRLFKAYLTNPHQLPDESLHKIIVKLKGNKDLATIVSIKYKEILDELIKNIPSYELDKGLNEKLKWENSINKKKSAIYPRELTELSWSKDEIKKFINSSSNGEIRNIIDNAILKAVPYWKSILSRGICDFIASLTDQEAINEYEKLYAGIMELL